MSYPKETGSRAYAVDAEASAERSTFLNRLERALSRLEGVTDITVANAISLTGGWPEEARADKGPVPSNGVFGAVEDIAGAIHRLCDKIDGANTAVRSRLP